MTPKQKDEELFSQIEASQQALKALIDDSARMAARSEVLVGYVRAQNDAREKAETQA